MGKYYSHKLILFALALFGIIILFSSCQKQSFVNLGLALDLTGRASGLGVSGRNGAVLAVENINNSGGINGKGLKLIIKDDKGNPIEAEKVDKELMQEDIILTIGHDASGTGLAGLKVHQENNKLLISPTMSTVSLSGIDDNFIRIIDTNDKQGKVLAEAALKLTENVAIFYEDTNKAYSYELSKAFRSKYETEGGRIVYEDSFTSHNATPLDRYAHEIIASGADGVLIIAGGLDVALLTQYIRKEKPQMQIFAGMWAMTGDLLENGGKAIEGIYLAGVYDERLNRQEFVEFREHYIQTFSSEPTFSSLYHYETVMLVAEVLKQSKKTDAENLKASIIKIKNFKGLQSDFEIDKYGDTSRGYSLFKVKNAGFVKEANL